MCEILEESKVALPEDLPWECLPQGPRRGAANYTIKDPGGPRSDGRLAIVQVHLTKAGFYVKAGNLTDLSPTVKWSKHGGVKNAWLHVVRMVGGWGSARRRK